MLVQDQRTINEKIRAIIQENKSTAFMSGYAAQDQEALGLLIARYFDWDGVAILETLYNALEDANFHTENQVIEAMIEKLKAR
jgi:hypothetical protein